MRERLAPERRHPLPRTDYSNAAISVSLAVPLQAPFRGILLDVSANGLGVFLPEQEGMEFGNPTALTVTLGDGLLASCPARIVYTAEDFPRRGGSAGQRLGLQLLIDREQPLSQLSFSRTDPDWDLINDKEGLQDLFADLLAYGAGCEMRIHGERGMKIGRLLEPGGLKEQRQIQIALDEVGDPWVKGETSVVTFERYGCTYLFHAEIRERKAGAIALSLPKMAIRLLRRRTSRLSGQGIADFSIALVHPLRGTSVSGLPLIEINEQGCLTCLPPDFPLAPIDLSRIAIEISWGQRQGETVALFDRAAREDAPRAQLGMAKLNAAVCSLRPGNDGACRVGLSFRFPSEDSRRLLTAELIRRRRPMIDIVYRPEDHPKIWKLLDESKYLDEKSRESFAPMVDFTKIVWPKLQRGMDVISRKILIRRGDEVVGHLQMDRAYPDTWMVHQLAIHPTMSKLIAGDLYSTVTDFLSGRGIKYLLSATRLDKAWNQRNYYDFIKRYPFADHNHIETFQLLEFNFANPINPSQLSTDNYTEYDLNTVTRYFGINMPRLKREALALKADSLTLNSLDKFYRAFDLQRKRNMIVFKKNRKVVSFALLDEASTGLNICNLYDYFEVFHIAEMSSSEKAIIEQQLIDACLNYYKNINKPGVVYLAKEFDLPFYEKLRFKLVCNEIRWFADCAASHRYEAFTRTLYGRLIAKRNLHRNRNIE